MKAKISLIALLGLFLIGAVSCKKKDDPASPTPVPVKKGITITPASVSLKPGETAVLTATLTQIEGAIDWTVEPAEGVISLDPSGAGSTKCGIEAIGEGTATVTATCGEYKATCTVEVKNAEIKHPTVQPTEGMITIAFLAPEVSCDGLVINMFGDFQDNNTEDTSYEASVYDGTQWPGWYVVTFPDNDGSGTAQGKLCPQALGSGVGTWNYQAKDFDIIEGPAERVGDMGSDAIKCNDGCVGKVIYVNVKQWSGDPCSVPFPGGDVEFNIILTNEFPEGFDISTIQIAVAHWDVGQDELTYDFTYVGPGYKFTGIVADFPAGQQYKYNIQYTPDGGEPSGWIWEKGDDRSVPYSGKTEDEVAVWESEPWNPIPGGTGKFTITFSEGCNMAQYEKVIFTGNFAEESWGDSQREMTKEADNVYSWEGEFPDNFMYKVIGRTEGAEDAWIGPGDNWKFDGATFEQSWTCE
ncbi:MAG: Ig-like domain-containing protein [Paludibacteraceae bacterium]|nr:Ig-like domain-containing protein [Paludibacteraceae bacterium]